MSSRSQTHNLIPIALILGALLVSACSGSSPTADDSQTELNDGTVLEQDESASDSNANTGVATENATVDSSENVSSQSTTTSTSDGVVADPEVQNSTRIDFEITVPAYSSDALQLEFAWGAKLFYADWIGDQFWTASDVFPTNATLPLRVTFYDANVDLTLGQYEQDFNTGTNATQIFKISADQFNTEQWDDDGDGVSNIEELKAGRHPLRDDALNLAVREYFSPNEGLRIIRRVSSYYESSIPSQRPYNEQINGPTPDPNVRVRTETVNIDIDMFGNGGYYFHVYDPRNSDNRFNITQEAVRTRTADSVNWTGTYEYSTYPLYDTEEIEFTTDTKMSAGQFTQNGTIIRSAYDEGSGPAYIHNSNYSLTGNVESGFTTCEAVSGNIVYEGFFYPTIQGFRIESETTVSRNKGDQYWSFTVKTPKGLLLDEYLVPSIETTIHCEFGP